MRRLLIFLCAASAFLALCSTASATHGVDAECSEFENQSHAQDHLLAHPGDPDALDEDGDGEACELLPCPCAAGRLAPTPTQTPASRPESARMATGRVSRVIDGDTLKVRLNSGRTVTVQLIGIDAPETRAPGTRVECGGIEATARMKKLALAKGRGRIVTLRSAPNEDAKDRYERLLAYVHGAGVDFGRTMISSGWAKTSMLRSGFQRLASYRRAEASAKSAKRGVWRKCRGNFHRPR